jgi:hypothetical protein
MFAGPLLLYVTTLLHPDHLLIGVDPWRFIAVHLAVPVLVCLVAWTLLLLVDGIDNRAAAIARLLVIPFAVSYSVFTTFDGVAIGAFVWKTNELPAAERPAAARLINSVSQSSLAHPLYLVAGALWLAAVLAVVVALRRSAPLPALALITVGAAAFALSHVRPWGPLGMAAFLAGVVWFELRSNRVAAASTAIEST